MPRFRLPTWVLGAMLVFIALQGYFAWKDDARPWLSLIRRFGLISGFQRGEINYIGYQEAGYVRFLDAYIPKDSPVLLPDSQNAAFTNQSIMQFYLYPRQIWLCGDPGGDQCRDFATDPGSFLLAIRDFPPTSLTTGKVFIPFPEASGGLHGLYAPAALANQLPVPSSEVYNRLELISWSAPWIEMGILAAFFLLGGVYVFLFLDRPHWIDILGLSIPLGIGLLSWVMFLSSYIGFPITLVATAVWYLLLIGAGLLLQRRFHRSRSGFSLQAPLRALRDTWRTDRWALVLLAVLVSWFGLSLLISVGQAYANFDGITNWYLKGYAMVTQHTIWAGKQWGGHVLAYPMNLQLTMGIFELADGDQLPGSKALFPILAASLLLECYQFLRRHTVGKKTALVALLSLFTLPVFFSHSTISLANLPLATYLLLGAFWTMEGLLLDRQGWNLLGGALFAFAAWTRPEGIGYSLFLLGGIYGAVFFAYKIKTTWKQRLASILPMLIIPGSWLVLLGFREMKRDQIGSALGGFFSTHGWEQLLWEGVRQLGQYTWNYFTNWRLAGFFVLASLIVLAAAPFLHLRENKKIRFSFLLLTGLAWLFPMGMFLVDAVSAPGFVGFLDQSFGRALLPGIVMLTVSAFLVFGNTPADPAKNRQA